PPTSALRARGRRPRRRRDRARRRPDRRGWAGEPSRSAGAPAGPPGRSSGEWAAERVALVTSGKAGREAGDHVYAVRGLGPLEVSGHVVQLGQPTAFPERNEQLDRAQGAAELLLDPADERLEALAAHGRDEHRIGMAVLELEAPLGIDPIGLGEDEDLRRTVGADLGQDVLHG